MKLMTSPAAAHHRPIWDNRIQNKKIKERRSGYAPIMYVPHISQRDDALLYQIPQIFYPSREDCFQDRG
jgi:hypothetical protein